MKNIRKKYLKILLSLFVICFLGAGTLYFSNILRENQVQAQSALNSEEQNTENNVLHETCQEYFGRRISEGWEVVEYDWPRTVLLSPDGNIKRELDLRNDVETLRPNGVGDTVLNTIGGDSPAATNWESVDETTPDESTTFVYGVGSWRADLHNLQDSSIGAGTINKVTIYARIKYVTGGYARLYLKTNGITHESSNQPISSTWATYSWEHEINPITSNSWTWTEIDNLQAGYNLLSSDYGTVYCTQSYVEVDYTPPPPEVSTLAASGVGATSAIFNGNITDDGGATITVRGFEYGISTSSVSTTSESGSFGTGAFSLIATDLEPEQLYYFRAFATNENGTGYGDWENAAASRGCNPPTSGDFTITQSCTFPGFVNGVEEQNGEDGEGDIIIEEGTTLTINCGKDVGQTIVWNPGSKVIINGSIAICKGAGMTGGQLRKAYLWMVDADNDTYSASTTQYASLDAPSGDHKRRYTMATTTNVDCNDSSGYVYRLVANLGADADKDAYISGATGTQCVGQEDDGRYQGTDGNYSWLDGNDSLGSDTNDSNDCIDTTTHLCCDDTNPTDGLQPAKTAGEQGLSACQRCNGTSIDAVNIADNTGDSEGTNKCDADSGDCYRCLSGSCTYQTSTQDLFDECAQGTTTDDGCESDNCSGSDYACGVQTSGDGGCPVCGTCTGATSIACEYHTTGTYDSGCNQCTGCSGSEIGTCTTATSSNWESGDYGCGGEGGDQRCYDGTCYDCSDTSGYLYSDGCSGCAGQGGKACWRRSPVNDYSCDEVCASYGECIQANWNDTSGCTINKHWYSACDCTPIGYSNQEAPYTDTYPNPDECGYRAAGFSQSCSEEPGPGYYTRRMCVCAR